MKCRSHADTNCIAFRSQITWQKEAVGTPMTPCWDSAATCREEYLLSAVLLQQERVPRKGQKEVAACQALRVFQLDTKGYMP